MCGFGIAAAGPGLAQTMVLPGASKMSTIRLVAGAGLHDGRYEAGIDLTMAPGSHTYWKAPGESGVPPVFAFNGSENVTSAEIRYPVPTRIKEEGIEAYGYDNGVVFPVAVTPADPGKPSVLHVDMTYAVCNRICMPAHGEASLTLSPRGSGTSGALVEAAVAKVPQQVAHVPDLAIAPAAGAKGSDPAWTLTWSGKTPPTDIFPAAPEGFFFDTKKTGDTTWTLTAQASVSTASSTKVPVSLVLAVDGAPKVVSETFDVGPPSK